MNATPSRRFRYQRGRVVVINSDRNQTPLERRLLLHVAALDEALSAPRHMERLNARGHAAKAEPLPPAPQPRLKVGARGWEATMHRIARRKPMLPTCLEARELGLAGRARVLCHRSLAGSEEPRILVYVRGRCPCCTAKQT